MIHKSPYPAADIPDLSFTDYLFEHAGGWKDRTAIACGATGRSYTYAQLTDAIRRVSAGLHARGVRKGDVVAIVSPNVPEFAIAFHAIASLGAICTTVNPMVTAEDLGKQLADSRTTIVFTVPPLLALVQDAASKVPTVRELVVFGEAPGATPLAALLATDAAPPRVTIDPARDIVALPYSSGTSGIPKGVMLTHRNLVANVAQVTSASPLIQPGDVTLGVLPFFHIYGMVVVLGCSLREGLTLVSLPRFELEQCLQVMQDHRVTLAWVVPPIVLALAKHPAVAKYDLSALRLVFSGAAPLGRELAAACGERLGIRVRQGYGLTETSPVTHAQPASNDRDAPDSIGPLMPGTECRLVDPETGSDVGVDERGEVWIRGPQVMLGYLNRPDATAACITPEGWFKTGDVGVVDEHGWFRIVDRVKELIKFKGFQVAPAELEAILVAHPRIADAAVIPSPDEEAGEIPKAFVVLREPLTPEEIMAYVAERVSPHKKVRAVEITDVIPKSPSGKILRRVLVERERAARTASA